MKKLLFMLPAFALLSCGGSAEPAGDKDTAAVTTPVVVDSSTVTAENAAEVKFYEQNPESVSRYFYASRIRGDKNWESVCVPVEQRTEQFVEDLVALDKKHVIRYTHLKTNCDGDACNVQMELEWTDDSKDSATETLEHIVFLENIDGLWWIIGFSNAVQE